MRISTIEKNLQSLKTNSNCEIEFYLEEQSMFKGINHPLENGQILTSSKVLELLFEDTFKYAKYQFICEEDEYYTQRSASPKNYTEVVFYGKKHGKTLGEALSAILKKEGLKCPAKVAKL